MKLKYKILIALLPMISILMSCNEEKPFSVAGADDEPHILAPLFPNRVNGELPIVATINRDANFTMDLTVTPADYVDVVWYIDEKEVASGKSIDLHLLTGVYNMKVVVKTNQGKSTSREGIVKINPLDGDPYITEMGFERFIAPENKAMLYGTNLDIVKGMTVGGIPVSEMTVEHEGELSYISYIVPTGIYEGTQRVVLTDVDGVEYGGGTVSISSLALITSGADRAISNSTCTMTGINLDKVASLDLGGKTITDFVEKKADMLQFTCPTLEDGEYSLTGVMTDGGNVTFFKDKGVVTDTKLIVSSEQKLWSGHFYVSWDLPDGNPNKMFSAIGKDVFASIKPGAVMSIHYSLEPADAYHQIRTTSVWWNDLPGTGVIEPSTDGVLQVILTQEVLNLIMEQEGFLCVGHGYFVDMVTLK